MKTENRSITLTSIFAFLLLFLIIFYYHIDKYINGVLFLFVFLLMPLSFIALIVQTIKAIIEIIRNRKQVSFRHFIPLLISTVVFGYIFLVPYRLDSENLESRGLFKVCYEGTQNQCTIKFRKDNSFDVRWSSFGSSSWWTGIWVKRLDTLRLKYDGDTLNRLGSLILIKDGYLVPLDTFVDPVWKRPSFYLGECRNEN